MKLSIIIVSYNVKHYLHQCIDSLLKAVRNIDAEICVIDNHSKDGTVESLKHYGENIKVIASNHNNGFAKANNMAIRQTTGEYVLLINPDTVVGEDSIKQCIAFMDSHAKTGGLGVQMLKSDGGKALESRRGLPTPMTSFYKMCGLCAMFPKSRRFGRYYMCDMSWSEPGRIEVVSGAFFFARRSALDKVGLLDEDFFMYGEDIDLSHQIELAGYKNIYLPERLLHYKGESTRRDLAFVRRFYGAMLLFYEKYYPEQRALGRFIRCGVYLLGGLSAVAKALGFPRKKKRKHRRLLIICRPENYDAAKAESLRSLRGLSLVKVWNLDENRTMEAIGRNIQMRQFTDIAFVWPDVRYEQMFLYMDKMPNKTITYHIYNVKSARLVSPGE